jgi:hypothetical protein
VCGDLRQSAGLMIAAAQAFATRRRWTDDEDERLRAAVASHGVAQWADVERAFGGGRSALMCRERWHYYLRDADNPRRVRRQGAGEDGAPKPSGGHSMKGTALLYRL